MSGFQWQLLSPHTEVLSADYPCPREAPTCILPYRDQLYMFGGGTLKYGASVTQGNKATLGSLNDLWRYDPAQARWTMLEPDDGLQGFSASARRPCTRILPAWVAIDDAFYLFGGLSILSAGWKFALLNDLWRYSPDESRWDLLEPDDGLLLEHSDCAGAGRPTTIGGFATAVVGSRIYLFGGWGHRSPMPPSMETTVLSHQLWCYDTSTGAWRRISRQTAASPWPAKRYVIASCVWNETMYIWGGRDTQDRDPQFYNDLWAFDSSTEEWTCIQEQAPSETSRPSPRYGMGSTRNGNRWYIFGGFGHQGQFLPEEVNGPQLNDLWCFDLASRSWSCVQPHDASKDYTAAASHPGVRRVPGIVSLSDGIYLFGGLDLASGPKDDGPVVGFNDFWLGRQSD